MTGSCRVQILFVILQPLQKHRGWVWCSVVLTLMLNFKEPFSQWEAAWRIFQNQNWFYHFGPDQAISGAAMSAWVFSQSETFTRRCDLHYTNLQCRAVLLATNPKIFYVLFFFCQFNSVLPRWGGTQSSFLPLCSWRRGPSMGNPCPCTVCRLGCKALGECECWL